QWKEPRKQNGKNIVYDILFEGKAYDLEWIQMSAHEIRPSKTKANVEVPVNEEHLMIIKSGNLSISINNATYSIDTGSVALLMPGEKFALQNLSNQSCKYYVMKYRSKSAKDVERGKTLGGSLVKDWNKIEFKSHDKGGRRDFFERPTAMCKRMEIHVTTLKESLKSHDPHTHKAEEIILVTEGKTEMQIGDQFYKGGEGSIYYLGSNVPHALQNIGRQNCTYFAIQFE
ncbi:MAG: AraC family ligand binding domain-containing protein, partial [Flavisolibacter sp.]|nr:AraC family ligand binding domain-containing protein [Flavisolibacter sp.]